MFYNLSIVIIVLSFLLFSRCTNAQNHTDWTPTEEHATNDQPDLGIFEGYVDDAFLNPNWLKNKFYINMIVRVDSSEQIIINGERTKLKDLRGELETHWSVIIEEGSNAFLQVNLLSDRRTNSELYELTYNNITKYQQELKDLYSLEEFKKPYTELNKEEAKQVNYSIVFNIVEVDWSVFDSIFKDSPKN